MKQAIIIIKTIIGSLLLLLLLLAPHPGKRQSPMSQVT